MIRAALVLLALVSSLGYADKLVNLNADNQRLGVVVLIESPFGLLIEREELAAIKSISPAKLAALPAVAAAGCVDCIKLTDVGAVEEDHLRAGVALAVAPGLHKVTELFSGKPRETVAVQNGAAFILNYSVLARESDSQASRQAYILEPSVSLGPLGVLESGWIIGHESGVGSESYALDTKLTRYFVGPALSLQLGEVRSLQAYNQVGQSIIGIRLARDFSISPDISSSPMLSFYADVERPSTVSLFVNGQKRRQQEMQNPGEVRLTDYRPNASGRVAVVVTDITGSEKVIELDLYEDRDLLNPGQFDFAVTAGNFNSERFGLADAPVADGFVRIGLTHWLALGLSGTWADYTEEDPRSTTAQFGDDYWLARLGLTARLRGLGKIELSAAEHEDSFGSSQTSRAFWSNGFLMPNKMVLSMGGFFFNDEGLRSAAQENLSHKGYRMFGGLTASQWSVTANGYDIDDDKGIGGTVEYRLGKARISASVSDSEFSDPLYLLRFSYRFGKDVSAGLKSRYQEDNKQFESGAYVRASMWDRRVNFTADHAESVSYLDGVGPEPARSSLRVNIEAPIADIGLQYQSSAAEQVTSGLVTGSLLLDSSLNMRLSPRVSGRTGLLTVTSSEPDLPFKAGAEWMTTGAKGSAVVPISGFSRHVVQADVNGLPLGVYVDSDIQSVAVYPGQSARLHFDVVGIDVRIAIEQLAAGSSIVVGGNKQVYDGRHVNLQNVMPGLITIETEFGRFVADVPVGHIDNNVITAKPIK
ncbi:MAG: outer membrane usher protein FimD/PapC [Zhongshania sp.]|jgi:outer membrane usher protein FimD/PapC